MLDKQEQIQAHARRIAACCNVPKRIPEQLTTLEGIGTAVRGLWRNERESVSYR
jgi:hypothetical protein